MPKLEFESTLRKALFLLLFSLVFSGIGYLLAILISHQFNYNLQDVLFCEGIFFIMIGAFMSMKGNPSGANFNAVGQNDAQFIAYQNNEVTRVEREITNYHKNFLKNSIVEFRFSGLTMILCGAFIIVFCIFYGVQ